MRGKRTVARDAKGGFGGDDAADWVSWRPLEKCRYAYPIEWPIRMRRTPGLIVGEGVLFSASRSITLFWSLFRE